MAKVADRYLTVNPWVIEEKGFHKKRSLASESIFSVGNEYMGVRGYFEEGYCGDTMLGSYFNGVFERFPQPRQFFRGISVDDHAMVNAVDWLHTRIVLDGERLDCAQSTIRGFSRRLDLRTGVLTREFVWTTAKGRNVRVSFRRFTNMLVPEMGWQLISFCPLDFSGTVRLELGLDFDTEYRGKHLWECAKKHNSAMSCAIIGRLPLSGHMVFSSMRIMTDAPLRTTTAKTGPKYVGRSFSLRLQEGKTATVRRMAINTTDRSGTTAPAAFWKKSMRRARSFASATYAQSLAEHVSYWARVWHDFDITIQGDKLNQQGIRFCIFQLHQTYHGVDASLNVAAKGLTGEVYDGKAWWDTETYCLPFFLFNNQKAARNLIEFRHRTLKEAVDYAPYVDGARGARYPMCTIDGTETCGTWYHGALEIHVSAAVAYGVWHYVTMSGDTDFLYSKGIEILLQVCRYHATRGEWSQSTGEYGFWKVMGPDEFHMQENNNAYTNVMAKKMFEYTLSVIDQMARTAPAKLARARRKVGLKPSEPRAWRTMARKMRTNFDKKRQLYEQHDGFFDLPHIDCDKIPPSDFPLYRHWPYLKIFRYDMIKQPDVLLLMLFFSNDYSRRAKKANFEYYEPRCIHESSLSPAIHSILAAELGKHALAYKYFQHATRIDLDDYNRNACEGLHITSAAAAWMNIVQGFGGMRTDASVLSFTPSIPRKWRSFTFRITYRDSILTVRVDKKKALFVVAAGPPITVRVFGTRYRVGKTPVEVAMPAARVA
ncbi:MAG: family 65 glycosyl hydrolase [Chitinivibrionales bacterium]|nr:family 65 glycosyl hydrolase [Chitinivibrionales bacterium]MBD3395252.1 family 65 glycosyl hydrolase [Chitinivibrionales bacterium]